MRPHRRALSALAPTATAVLPPPRDLVALPCMGSLAAPLLSGLQYCVCPMEEACEPGATVFDPIANVRQQVHGLSSYPVVLCVRWGTSSILASARVQRRVWPRVSGHYRRADRNGGGRSAVPQIQIKHTKATHAGALNFEGTARELLSEKDNHERKLGMTTGPWKWCWRVLVIYIHLLLLSPRSHTYIHPFVLLLVLLIA